MLVLAGLAGVIALAWVWLLAGAGLHMDEMDMGGGQVMLDGARVDSRICHDGVLI